MADLKVCSECRKLFLPNDKNAICKECQIKEQQLFTKIQEFQSSYPCANLYEISLASSISVTKVQKYVKKGKIEVLYG